MVFGLRRTTVYTDDDDFQWTDDEEEDEKHEASSDEEHVDDDHITRAGRLDEANVNLIEDQEVKAIVEMTNKREKEVFTGKGKKFAYPTEWKSDEGCGRVRFKIHMVMDGLVMRLVAMILVLIDVIMVLISVTEGTGMAGHVISLFIVTYFLLDLMLRVFAWGKTFFKDWLEVFDGIVVVIAFVVTVIIEALHFTTDKEYKIASLVIILRFVRFSLYLRILFHTGKSIYMALRYKATQSKKRYVQDGYDLDLTYITSNVIAMSFPSSGAGEIRSFPPTKVDMELAIRNPKAEVARFFNEKYPHGRYRIYNLCKERGYDTSIFHDQVARFKIVDHNVPKMSELLDFCENVETYMKENKDNVIAVHCKGGKGRTGCCIASWLLYSRQWTTAKGALDYFGGRRMDVAKGVKFQGVETPSQKRYVYYLGMMMKKMGGKMPPVKELIVKTLEIKGLDEHVYADLRMDIVINDVVQHKILLTKSQKKSKKLLMNFNDDIKVAGDVKFRFKSKRLGRDYDNCAFFFWLHTSFIQKNKFEADRYEIGNANKPKHNDKYNEQFNVKLIFADVDKRQASTRQPVTKQTESVGNMETENADSAVSVKVKTADTSVTVSPEISDTVITMESETPETSVVMDTKVDGTTVVTDHSVTIETEDVKA